jgi:hypothetical protein
MKKIVSILILFTVIFCLNTLKCDGQDQKTDSLRSPQRTAEGQSKWMMSQLKFDNQLYQIVYNINLKYQIKTDSIHSLKDLSYDAKKKLYASALKSKKDEFKKSFPTDIYDQYETLLESAKLNAPSK